MGFGHFAPPVISPQLIEKLPATAILICEIGFVATFCVSSFCSRFTVICSQLKRQKVEDNYGVLF